MTSRRFPRSLSFRSDLVHHKLSLLSLLLDANKNDADVVTEKDVTSSLIRTVFRFFFFVLVIVNRRRLLAVLIFDRNAPAESS